MDPKEVKLKFHHCSNEVINFLNKFEHTTYISTLLVVNNNISAHQSNGYAEWDNKFYYEGKYKDSLLIKMGIELTKINKGDVSTVIWDDALRNEKNNIIDVQRKEHNIYHGVSFIYGIESDMSMALNICTGADTSQKEFENLILPMRFALLNYFKDL
ncbi:hypothetical protein [Erwinia rhapontici]|uniref:hypothetical protein n=1 Tax=Erwinia rhapontici TaxID=55212 RepID=UPI0021679E88|nr:hypothetical protein [Erwinia rhapontici]MCS3609618.1 hypothetical protein [Erwinia rhapontici]